MRVNPGVEDADAHQSLSGWEAKIIAEEDGYYLLAWTEETLAQQPEAYQQDSDANGLDATRYYLAAEHFTVLEQSRELADILAEIKGDGSFFSNGEVPAIPLGLTIDGYGEVALPLKKKEAKRLFDAAEQAPFGRGLETVLDRSVRNAREIDATRFEMTNPAWENTLANIADQVANELNVNGFVIAEPYKLLVYAKGGFFLPHRDSEKAPGMFATLIVGLPSKHEGGSLSVRFDGEEKTADFTGHADGFAFPFAAFFADCEHELKEVSAGYRVCLVYNLCRVGAEENPRPVAISDTVEELSKALKTTPFPDPAAPRVVLLDHQYTPANFSIDGLKADDRGRAQALLAAADAAGYVATLGLVTHYRMGELEDDGSYYNNYRRSYWGNDQEEEKSPGTMGSEIFEETTELMLSGEAGGVSLGTFPISEQDFLIPRKIGEGEPTEQEEEGYTGNAGMTIEYWYHYGAVALWPRAATEAMIGRMSLAESVNWLPVYLRSWGDERMDAPRMVRRLLERLVDGNNVLVEYGRPVIDFGAAAGAMLRLKEPGFFRKHGIQLLAKGGAWVDSDHWKQLAETFGEPAVAEAMSKALEGVEETHLKSLLDTLLYLKALKMATLFAEAWPAACNAVKRCRPTNFTYGTPLEDDFLPALARFKLLSEPGSLNEAQQALAREAMTASLNRKYIHQVLPKAIALFGEHYLAEACRAAAVDWLRAATATELTEPGDWAKPAPKINHSVSKALGDFMRDPVLRVFDFKAVQRVRRDLEYRLGSSRYDLSWETIRQGSPHTMRITKTHGAYQRAVKERGEDLGLLERLER